MHLGIATIGFLIIVALCCPELYNNICFNNFDISWNEGHTQLIYDYVLMHRKLNKRKLSVMYT